MMSRIEELRAIGLGGMYKATVWFIFCAIASSMLLWIAAFGLRVYLRYDVLDQEYKNAADTLKLASHRSTGYMYSKRHPTEIKESKDLLKMSRKKRALIEEWNQSHLCGSYPCTELLMGQQTLQSLVMYFLASAFGVSLIANGVINIFWLVTRSSITRQELTDVSHCKSD